MKDHPHTDSLAELVSSEGFLRLDPDVQKRIIDTVSQSKDRPGGFLGRLLGSRSANLAIQTVLILCLALLLVVIVDNLHAYRVGGDINMELINIVIPVISLAIGYIFGRGAK